MKRLRQVKGKLSLLLILAVSVLCAGFFIVSCGNDPQKKTKETNAGAFAVDFSKCPSGVNCSATPKGSDVNRIPDISNQQLTLEAWVKTSVTTTTGTIFKRSDDSKGVELALDNNVPKFKIRRGPVAGDVPLAQRTALSECVQHGTSTECVVPAITQVESSTTGVAATFTIPGDPTSTLTISSPGIFVNSATKVNSFIDAVGNIIELISGTANSIIVPPQTVGPVPNTNTFDVTVTSINSFPKNLQEDDWTHIAGVITNSNQSSGPNNCSADPDGNGILQGAEHPHLAIYINGKLNNCASTNEKFTDNPNNEDLGIGPFLVPPDGSPVPVVIDELRFWVSRRTETQINNCMNTELGIGGECDRGDPDLAAYFRLNEGKGADVTDFSGNGFSGGFEFRVGDAEFEEWEDGWVLRTDGKTPASAE